METTITKKEWLHRLLFARMDIASLAVLRMLFGIIIMSEAWRYTDLIRIVAKFTRQDFYFKFRFFEWVGPISPEAMRWLFIAYFLSGLFITLGILYRPAIITAVVCISYIFLVDATNYLNHFYLVIIFTSLMFFVPAHRAWSVHVWIFPKSALQTVPAWCVWLLRFELGLVYSYAALAKMNVDWINGMPLFKWIGDKATATGPGQILSWPILIYGFSYGGLVYDLLVTPLLLIKRTRAMAYCLCLSFHLTNYYLFNIGIFPWFMIATTTIFFEPDWPRSFLNFFLPKRFVLVTLPSYVPRRWNGWQTFGVSILAVHMVFQALFPLRHFVYPGYVGWDEEGHNFSWHMKLRGKHGSATFTVRDPETGRSQQIDTKRYLTKRQETKMVSRPELILQFAHFLRDTYTIKGEKPAEVYVESKIRLNSRKSQRLIDPSVNLAAEEDPLFAPRKWVFPIRQPVWNAEHKRNRFGPALRKDEIAMKAIHNFDALNSTLGQK